ncbi:MAG: hypothetical protein QM756_27245 [Polyangiaceae bacterium]
MAASSPAESPSSDAATDSKESGGGEDSKASNEESKGSAAGDGDAGIPKDCYKSGGACFPHPKFVKKLCNTRNPSMALYLFGNGFEVDARIFDAQDRGLERVGWRFGWRLPGVRRRGADPG